MTDTMRASSGGGTMLASYAGKGANSFGVVRLAAAIAVIFTHAFGVVGGWEAAEPLHASTGLSLGAHAVHVFFALSGFMVAASWERATGVADFALARLLRIMPALVVVNLAIILIGGIFLTTASPQDYWSVSNIGVFLARTTLLFSVGTPLAGVFADNPMAGAINIPIWTIRFEVICYATLLFVLAAMATLRLRGLARLPPVAAILLVSVVMVSRAGDPDLYGFGAQMARFAIAFYLGVAFWIAKDRIAVNLPVLTALASLTALALYGDNGLQVPLLIATTAYGSFWAGSFKMGWLQRATDSVDLSYGTYIAGFFIQQLLIELLPNSGVMTNALLATVIALAVAWVSWTYVEKPAMGLRRKFVVVRKPATAVEPIRA